MTPTTDQVSGMLDRAISGALLWLVTFILAKLVTSGYLQSGDAAQLSPILILLGSAAYGYWVNRPKAIVQSAAALPGTVVVTTPDLSEATPGQNNIVSNMTKSVIDNVTKKVIETAPATK